MSKRVLFWVAVACLTIGVYGCAFAHEGHQLQNPAYKPQGKTSLYGGSTYLYGMNRRDPQLSEINCCKFGGDGDCRALDPASVKIVPGGYEWEGEFIAEATVTASPDDNYYGCKHPGAIAHCFHAPGSLF